MTKEELLKQVLGCPFCGELPGFSDSKDHMTLYCVSQKCPAAVQIYVKGNEDNYEELLTKWNTRAVGLFPQWSAEERKEAGDAFDAVMEMFNTQLEEEANVANNHDLVPLIWMIEKMRRREEGCSMNELIAEAEKRFEGIGNIKMRGYWNINDL